MRTTRRLFLGLIVAALAATLAIPAPLQAKLIKKVDGFELLVDLSESMGHELKTADGSIIQTGEPPKQGYFKLFDYKKGKTKFQVEYELLQMINESVPSLDYQAALRTFGYRIAFYTGHYTTLNWGVALFDRTAMGQAIAPLENALALSPLGYGMAAASEELAAMPRRKALLIFSDFQWSEYFGDPVGEAEKLKTKYGPDLCVYTFYFDPDPEKVRIAREIVKAAGCGKAYDTFKLRTDPDAFQDMIRDIFYEQVADDTPPPPRDDDGDGVINEKDKCPDTPKGAPVDERGCWIAAYDQYFDFDKSVIKDQFKPVIKKAADILRAHPALTVIIAGHTDRIGTEAYNMGLGERRALAVRKLLIEYGVPAERLKYRSYGESQPKADNRTAEGRSKNRRVEIHVYQPGIGRPVK